MNTSKQLNIPISNNYHFMLKPFLHLEKKLICPNLAIFAKLAN